MLRYLVWSLRLRRVEYRVAELPIFLIPVLLTISDTSAFLGLPFWEGLLIFFFLFTFGDLVNCLADRDLDAIYKPHLTEAVHGLGMGGVIAQAALSAVAAVALAAHLAWLLERWMLLAGVLAGLFLGYAYSVEPLRLKGRGLCQPAFFWLVLFAGPMLFAALLFTSWPSWPVLLVVAGFSTLQTGVVLVNTAEDYPEDRQMGVRTAIVALGLRRGVTLALVLALTGAVVMLAAFAALSQIRALPPWGMAFGLPLLAACAVVTVALARLELCLGGKEEEDVREVKQAGRWVPLWITLVALTSLLAAVGVFAWGQAPEGNRSLTAVQSAVHE